MSSRLLSLAAVLGAGLLSSAALAATDAEYQQARAAEPVVTLASQARLTDDIADHRGQLYELEGVVTGVVQQDGLTGYLLQVGTDQSATIAAPLTPDIAAGNWLRVLARAPKAGDVLTQVAAMPQGAGKTDIAIPAQRAAEPAAPVAPAAPAPAKGAPASSGSAKKSSKAKRTPASGKTARAKPAAAPVAANVALYAGKIRQFNSSVSVATATQVAKSVLDKSARYKVDPRLVFALIAQESRFNPRAVSAVGAQGLGQLMPATARDLQVSNAFDIGQNVDGTVRYLAGLLAKFDSIEHALAAYNAGPGNVQRYGGIPPFRETQNYVRTVSTTYHTLTASFL